MIDHLWQSTLFIGAAWLLTLALRKNRAQVRYWVWFTASVKFLAPLALLVAVGGLVPKHAREPMARTEWAAAMQKIAEPAFHSVAAVAAAPASRNYVVWAAWAVWACGFLSVAICWTARWRRVAALRRLATPIRGMEFAVPVMSVPGLVEPGIFGILRPVLLLPDGIGERLTPAQLDAILAHELCHVRRRDNLTAAIHMLVQAMFWFHPLVWWLGARLVDERERACDEEVLRLGARPQVYAQGILSVCKLYVESPLKCVSGVTGSDLKRRVEAIMKNRNVRGLSFAKKAALAVAGIAAVAVPVAVGVLHAQPAPTPKWEVAAIRPCDGAGFAGLKGGGRSGSSRGSSASPGRLNLACGSLLSLIQRAYVDFADGQFNPRVTPTIEGGPAWKTSDRYTINAKAEGNASPEMMSGPMLQALLEDRFQLRIHRETRDVPVYALTVSKGGLKLKPVEPGSCVPRADGPPPDEPGQRPVCGSGGGRSKGPNLMEVDIRAMTLDEFSNVLGIYSDRPVINKTGVPGRFDIHMEAPEDITIDAAPGDPVARPRDPSDPGIGAPSILTVFISAQQQLGLKLESTKGPSEFLVIDHVERPSEN
jgi:uncharacterized protein (TIGR03435 family)